MPTIIFSLKDLQHLVGKKITIEEVEELAHYGKGDVESYDSETDEVKVDFGDTNLPYLWSVEGFSRLIKGILGLKNGIPEIKIQKGNYQVAVDKSVMKHRPYIACFAAKGRKIDDYLLKQIVQLQEKFCETYGRRRQKVSIGLYSYKRITFPIHYKAVEPDSIEFVPLEFKSKMNLKEILAEHPKGKEYAWILEGFERYPILIDDKNEVLSFIPVINSNFTGKLEIDDEDIFFEATGTDEEAVSLAANIFAYALYERSFQIHSVEIKYHDRKIIFPHMEKETITIKNEQIKQLFGLELRDSEIKNILEKAQYEFKDYKVAIAPYRKDILHPFDVIEDIGIIYGFDKIKECPLTTYTVGSGLEINDFTDKIREIVFGLGYQEVMNAVLTNKNLLYSKMNIEDFGTVEIEDYMTETYSVVRSWILPNLMEVFSKNKHVEFPQKIFEEGLVNSRKGEKIEEFNRIAIAISHEDANYTNIRQVLDCIMRCLGLHYDIEETEHNSFIEGRVGRAIAKGKKVAYLGEINTQVLENWGLGMPVAALELNLTGLFEVMGKKEHIANKISISINKVVLERVPNLFVKTKIIKDVSVEKSSQKIEEMKTQILKKWKNKSEDDLEVMPGIVDYRNLQKMFYLDGRIKTPAVENLIVRHMLKGKFPEINSAIDLANIMSVENLVPIGVFDLDAINGNIELRFSHKGDEYIPIGKDSTENVSPNIPILTDANKIFSVVGVRDSKITAVTENSKNLLLVSWGTNEADEKNIEDTLERCAELIKSK